MPVVCAVSIVVSISSTTGAIISTTIQSGTTGTVLGSTGIQIGALRPREDGGGTTEGDLSTARHQGKGGGGGQRAGVQVNCHLGEFEAQERFEAKCFCGCGAPGASVGGGSF